MLVRSTVASLLCVTTFVSICFSQEKEIDQLEQVDWLVGKWVAEAAPLEQDIAGFAEKGEEVKMHLEVKPIMAGKLLTATGVFHKLDGASFEAMHQVWGIDGGDHRLQQWFFGLNGMNLNGNVVQSAGEFIVKYEGKAMPKDGPLKMLATQLGLEELKYSAEAAYRVVDADTFALTIRNIKVAGQSFPWPGANREHIHHRVK